MTIRLMTSPVHSSQNFRTVVTDNIVPISVALAISVVISATIVINLAFVPSYWLDELYSVTMIQQSYGGFYELLIADTHLPLYFVLLKAWSSIGGDSELHLRSLSALFSILSVLSVYFVRAKIDKTTCVIFVALMLCNGLFLYHSQEVRPYSLLFMLSTFLSLAVFQFDKSTSQLGWILAIGTALAYVHYFGLLFAVLTYAVLALEVRRQPAKLMLLLVFTVIAGIWPVIQLLEGALGDNLASGYYAKEVQGPLDTLSIAACATASVACRASRIASPLWVGGALLLLIAIGYWKWFPWRSLKNQEYGDAIRLIMIVSSFICCVMVIDLIKPISQQYRFIILLPPVYLLFAHYSSRLFKSNTMMAKMGLLIFGAFLFLQFEQGAKHALMKVRKPENWEQLAQSTLVHAKHNEAQIFHYDNSSSEFYSKWRHKIYNYYIERLSNNQRIALPMKLSEVDATSGPYMLMFCHIKKSDYRVLSSKLEENFDARAGFLQDSSVYPDVCGMYQVGVEQGPQE